MNTLSNQHWHILHAIVQYQDAEFPAIEKSLMRAVRMDFFALREAARTLEARGFIRLMEHRRPLGFDAWICESGLAALVAHHPTQAPEQPQAGPDVTIIPVHHPCSESHCAD